MAGFHSSNKSPQFFSQGCVVALLGLACKEELKADQSPNSCE